MIRTICDLGILYYDQPLTRKMVMDFLGDEALEHNVKRVLKKYFMMVPGGKLTSYVNPVNQMAYAFPDLVFRYRC